MKAENIQDIIKSSEFSIDTGSLNSANPARDEKLKNLFFKDGKNVININGKVSDVKEDIIFVDIKIGNTTKNIPLRFSFNNNNDFIQTHFIKICFLKNLFFFNFTEISHEYDKLFKEHGGEKVQLVESLNSGDDWVETIKKICSDK